MKTVLLSINSKYIHSSLGVWYLKASANEFYDFVEIVESTIKEDIEKLSDKIKEKNPDIIGISCYIWNINFVKNLLPILRNKCPNSIIFAGGPEVSYNCEDVLLQNKDLNYILSGEGEKPFYQLLKALNDNTDLSSVLGLNGRDFTNAPHITDEEPKSPYTDEYLTALNGRIAYLETTRGCPYSCSYCLSGRLCKVKAFGMERVKNDIEILANSGTQTIKFVDRTFNCMPKRAKEIIDFIIEKNPVYKGVCYHFEMAGDIITQDIIDSLARADKGLFQIEVGVQSFNEQTLEAVNRKTNISKIENNLTKILSQNNIHVHMDLIAGLPKENIESFEISFNRLFKLRPHMLQLGFLKLLHGTPLEEENAGKFNDFAPYEIIENNWLSKADFQSLKYTEDAVERLYNSGRFKNLIEKVLEFEANAYKLFTDFGTYSKTQYKTSMEDYVKTVLEYFEKFIEKEKLIEIMKEQWIIVNSSGKLPVCLQNESMGALLKELDREVETKRKKAVKRAAISLENKSIIAWVDYENKDRVTGEYKIYKKKFT